MSLFSGKMRGPAVDAPPPPKGGVRRVWFLLKTHFGKFLSLNVLFLAFCVPVVTIPAAIAASDRVCLVLWREGNCFLWEEFWGEFKSELFNSLPSESLRSAGRGDRARRDRQQRSYVRRSRVDAARPVCRGRRVVFRGGQLRFHDARADSIAGWKNPVQRAAFDDAGAETDA
jgi:hypothetical protein